MKTNIKDYIGNSYKNGLYMAITQTVIDTIEGEGLQ
jgi:hypothetical protein